MATERVDGVILKDLKTHLQTAKIPIENLSVLAKQGDDQLVKQFLTENIHSEGSGLESRQSQLYIACFWGIKGIVQELLENGTDPNKQNRGSLWTPLHAAAFQENGPVVMILLQYGAQPELPDAEGRTPKDFASASDKIWPLFAHLNLERTSRAELIAKKIIRQGSARSVTREPGYGIKMAEYSSLHAGSKESEQNLQAAMMGDVLADEGDCDNRIGAGHAKSQPQFSLWK